MVNRIWQYHFGKGIVPTANDFGRMGTVPPTRNCSTGWPRNSSKAAGSMKPLHRMILLSSTYRQSGALARREAAQETDPENALLYKFSHRRLEAEEIRDAMLAVSGRLNLKAGGPSFMVPIDREPVLSLKRPQYWAPTRDKSEYDRRTRLHDLQAQSAAAVRRGVRRARTRCSPAPAANNRRTLRRRWRC